jgi:FkbM family methyltransferase
MYENFFTNFINHLQYQDGIAVDIGANIGYYSNLLSKKFKKVYAFEPEPNNIKRLKKNIINNNVVIVECAISDKTEKRKLFLNSNDTMHTLNIKTAKTYASENFNFLEIDCITLDDFFSNDKINFIKCDVEGEEEILFYGAKKTLINNKINILLEMHENINKNNLISFFNSIGYYNGSPKEKHHRFIHLTNI